MDGRTELPDVLPEHLNRHPHYPALKFHYGIKPYQVTEVDPSFKTCVVNFGSYEYGIIAATTLIPAYFGFSATSKEINPPFLF